MDDTITSAVFRELFPEQVSDTCSSDALEANNSPLAYLHALYHQALELEKLGDAATHIRLATRRPDIGERVLDEGSLEAHIPALTLVIEAMTREAKLHVGDKTVLSERIANAQYPVQLPFHYPLEQINAVLSVRQSSLFNLLQQTDYAYPNFVYGNLRTDQLRNIMRKATGFSPALQALLLEKSDSTVADFLLKRYGVTGTAEHALERLSDVEFLARQTGLKPEDIVDLLAVSGVADEGQEAFTAVKQSSAYLPAGKNTAPIAGHIFGAAFINNATAPALTLQDTLSGAGISLRIKGANADHLGRIHKIIHLQHALQLPYSEVDLLVMAALRAEGQTKDFTITENTLRALGVFKHLRNEYQISAEQFAALIDEVTPYAVGETKPFLNRVLDGPVAGTLAEIDTPLVLDARVFEIPTTTGVENAAPNPVIAELCRAFALEENVAILYLNQIKRTLGVKQHALTLGVFSSLYRLTRLPRLMRLGMNEGASLIALLDAANPQVMAQLAGKPVIASDEKTTDVLDVLIGLANLDHWLREHRITPTALLSWLTPYPANIPASLKSYFALDARIQRTVLDAVPRIKSSLVTESGLAQTAGAGVMLISGSWLDTLSAYIDSSGLIKSFALETSGPLASQLTEAMVGKVASTSGLLIAKANLVEIADGLGSLIQNAVIAQEDAVKHIIGAAFGKSNDVLALKPEHALPLLQWVSVSRLEVLAGILEAESGPPEQSGATANGLDVALWSNLARHAQVIKHFKLSAAGLSALLNKPEWFSLEQTTLDNTAPSTVLPVLNLDLCYQIGHYHDWVSKCEENGFEEKDALAFFGNIPAADDTEAVVASSQRLGKLTGWSESEALSLMSSLQKVKEHPLEASLLSAQPVKAVATFDDFLKLLKPAEKALYDRWEQRPRGAMAELLNLYMLENRTSSGGTEADIERGMYDKFKTFMSDNPAPLRVFASQYLPETKPTLWKEMEPYQRNKSPLTLTKYDPESLEPELGKLEPQVASGLKSTLSDIDYVLRSQRLCTLTKLRFRSVLDMYRLDRNATFDAYRNTARLLLGACSEMESASVQSLLQEKWRDALAGYLLGHWAPSTDATKTQINSFDDLSNYFLTDILVSSAATTCVAIKHIASLQHYLHRLFARLEPGYVNAAIPEAASTVWREYMSEYGLWKIWKTQINHPENLIYYANRPNKTAAFQSLEVELNQGKLDPALLQTAITSYLTKFEQTSNLQVVSGYLDGVDPKSDTYHFIGKTNTSPPEYYWRSVDMGLRDDKERLSPLAWTEWEKISVAPGGQITQSSYRETTRDKKTIKHTCDTIRPVMIEGRPYVFWVERGTVGLPSADEKNQTPTKFKKLTVQYIYKQSDGFWSPPNELLCLDGTKDGERLPDADNAYLKDDTYVPGLVALVDSEGERAKDPWLRVMLYDCAYTAQNETAEAASCGTFHKDYFIESRDLLLIDKKESSSGKIAESFSKSAYKAFGDIRKIQHPDSMNKNGINRREQEWGMILFALEKYNEHSLSTPNFNPWVVDEIYNYLDSGAGSELIDKPTGFHEKFAKAYPFLLQLPFWAVDSTRFKIVEITVKGMTGGVTVEDVSTLEKIPLVAPGTHNKQSSSEKNQFFANLNLPMTLDAARKRENVIQITAHYPKSIIKKSVAPTVSYIGINAEFSSALCHYRVTCQQNNISYTPGEPCTLLIKLETTDKKFIRVGYSVTAHQQCISEQFDPDETTTINLQSRTYSVKLKKADYLFEESFRIELFTLPPKLIKSLPMQIIVNPAAYEKIDLRLYAKGPNENSFSRLTEESVVANGQAVISQEYICATSGPYMFALCEAGDPMQNVFSTFDFQTADLEEEWKIAIKRDDQQAQYLDLSSVAERSPVLPSNAIRLNTLFGKQLVSRATRSVERALEWEAQCIEEPTIDDSIPTPRVDFHGANGAYFRELFLHLPNLVATRLSEQQQFDEAERWYTQYLFDPYRTQKDEKQRPPFWNTRPLADAGTGTSELQKVVNPTTRAFILSRYNRQAVFLSMVENWQRQGDHFYRQLTPSTLNHAWLSYQKALKLIGPLPERTAVSRWVPTALSQLEGSAFRMPINERVIETRKIIEHRLFNLRHGLTLDGKLLPVMDWRTEGTDPFGFAQRGIGHLISSYNSDRMQIPAYRFRQLIPMARAAVQQLQDMGRHYMKLMEDEFNTTLSVLLKQQEIRISDFTLRLKQEAINSVKAKMETLLISKEIATFKKDHFTNLIEVGRSAREEAATGLQWTAAILENTSMPPKLLASAIKAVVPNIYGLAVGGNEPSKTIDTFSELAEIGAKASKYLADKLLVEAGYERRANGWTFEQGLAALDIQSIDLQLKETNIELNVATLSMDEARTYRKNLEEAHMAMTTGFTIIPIYNWLVARQELLYAPAYDAVLSLCLSAEAAWRYEIGDYKRPAFVKTSAWIDSYKGMLAGESLLVDLQEMENAYLQSNERRLTIRKTINIWEAQTDTGLKILKGLKSTPLTCDIKSADFDRSYPGHYLRQLKHVSVSFVMAAEAGDTMKEVSTILTQTDSTTLIEPVKDGAEHLYGLATKPPASVKRNLRAQQQIALSSGTADDGLGFGPGDWVYELMFHDGRYLPFEGTGAISRWQLSFPDEQFVKSLVNGDKALVKSIQLHMVYTAVDGGKDFTDKVKALRDKP